ARASEPEGCARISVFVRGRFDRAGDARVHETLRRAAGALRPARGDGEAAAEDRQRTLYAGLLEVHPVLQVRGILRRGRAEYVCDRSRRARILRAYCHGV